MPTPAVTHRLLDLVDAVWATSVEWQDITGITDAPWNSPDVAKACFGWDADLFQEAQIWINHYWTTPAADKYAVARGQKPPSLISQLNVVRT